MRSSSHRSQHGRIVKLPGVLFGVSTPLARLLVERKDPWHWSGVLYLG
jgi:hypothetical protein